MEQERCGSDQECEHWRERTHEDHAQSYIEGMRETGKDAMHGNSNQGARKDSPSESCSTGRQAAFRPGRVNTSGPGSLRQDEKSDDKSKHQRRASGFAGLPTNANFECTTYGGAFMVQSAESSGVRTSTQNLSLMRAFAAELRAQRHLVGVSQEELAYLAGVNRTFVAKLELAQNQPTLTVLLKIAEGLRVQLPELIEATLNRYQIEVDAQNTEIAKVHDSSK